MKRLDLWLGLILAAGSIYTSVAYGFHFWYSFFVIGSFMFFGSLNFSNGEHTVYEHIAKKRWKRFLIIYMIWVFLGFAIDVVYGRLIGRGWVYPYLRGLSSVLLPSLIYYPFGALSIYEMFHYFRTIADNIGSPHKHFWMPDALGRTLIYAYIVGFAFGVVLPFINLYLNYNANGRLLMLLVLISTLFSADAVMYIVRKQSYLLKMLKGDFVVSNAFTLTWIAGVLLHEVPNVYSNEWVYARLPVEFSVLGVNIIVLTLGWLWLTSTSISITEMIRKI